MLQQYFGFTRLPFTKDIPPQQLFQAEGQSELCARLDYLLKDRGLGLGSSGAAGILDLCPCQPATRGGPLGSGDIRSGWGPRRRGRDPE